jgi:hypothetical protein
MVVLGRVGTRGVTRQGSANENGVTRTPADRDSIPDALRHAPDVLVPDAAGDGELWRGPTEARWVARLLHGARPPRDSAPSPAGLVAHG